MKIIFMSPVVIASGLVLLSAIAGFFIMILSVMKQINKQYTKIECGLFEELFGLIMAFMLIVIAIARIILYGGR